MKNINVFSFLFSCLLFPMLLQGQAFVKITDASNPIATFTPPGGVFPGCAWVDFDGDGDLDLSASPNYLFRNDGNGDFTDLTGAIGSNQNSQLGHGLSWGDYDNDGDIDCYLAGNPSTLFNNENGSFTIQLSGPLGALNSNRDWSCAWSDYDNDGWLDLVAAHPAGFLGPSQASHLYHNDGSGGFIKIDSFGFTQTFAPYTVAVWTDYDDDGDSDLFIGSGPGGSPGLDHLYENLFMDTGQPGFARIQGVPMATQLQDGQTWNWVDFDNDGDLDGFITNWGGAPNRFYLNDSGTYKPQNNILTISENSLANTWGDMDNDGDLDVLVTNQQGPTHYYQNNGDSTFSELSLPLSQHVFTCGATLGDYDNDGDLDIFFMGNAAGKGLWRNENPFPNHWINIRCQGTVSNRSAIGTKVKVRAVIKGRPVWQRREISAQNSFNSHNSLRVHFGLGDATVIDTLLFLWPSGIEETYVQVPVDSFMTVVEGMMTPIATLVRGKATFLGQNYPNPFSISTWIGFEVAYPSEMNLSIFDITGRKVATLKEGNVLPGTHFVEWNGKNFEGKPLLPGVYIYRLQGNGFTQTRKMVLM